MRIKQSDLGSQRVNESNKSLENHQRFLPQNSMISVYDAQIRDKSIANDAGFTKKISDSKELPKGVMINFMTPVGSHSQSLGDILDGEILCSDFQQYKTMGWCYQATKQFLRACKTFVARAKDLVVVHKSYRQQGPLPERPISTFPQYD